MVRLSGIVAVPAGIWGFMQLDLTSIRTPHTVIDRVFSPDGMAPDGDAYRIVAPVTLDVDIHKDRSSSG